MIQIKLCPYCATAAESYYGDSPREGESCVDPWTDRRNRGWDKTPDWEWLAAPGTWVNVCSTCGWWAVSRHSSRDDGLDVYGSMDRASATLRMLDLSDIAVPIAEVSRYLVAKYEDRFRLHPKLYEDLVGSAGQKSSCL